MKILLIEDNAELSLWLTQLLREQGFVVDPVADGEAAELLLREHAYDVVLLDLNLPGALSGKGVLRRLRDRADAVPVMVLTASASLDQKVQCLEIGADDYLVKPVEIRELVARIQALVRRQVPGKANVMLCGDLAYDLRTRQFALKGQDLALPPRERSLLEALMLKSGKAVSKPALLAGIFALDEEASADAVDLYVHRLRRKLEGSQAALITLRGVGYLLKVREEDS
ncbi:response regulator transcription factor [Pelomonas sp. KK5]|uniref:response regulator transcription factor n=1 Tax=Pelomonas sp. KK5 TaxID=1855730 RepID=UPI00097C12AF|nr:response regulator transcription factor [Pelomonas sp. KK5]